MASLAEWVSSGIAVCDAETDAEVEAAADFVESPTLRLAAGPAGFATHLARLMDLPPSPVLSLPCARNTLIVNGSLHNVSTRQIEQARNAGFCSLDAAALPAASHEGGWVILEQGGGKGEATLDFARGLAKSVLQLLPRAPLDALIIFGGDTAYAIVEALGGPPLHPLGEVLEGIPISRIDAGDIAPHCGPRERDLLLVTKAGSFGAPAVLASLRGILGER